jgi:hypothetical protein
MTAFTLNSAPFSWGDTIEHGLDDGIGLIADLELDCKHEELVIVAMVDEVNVHHALLASETFFTGCVKMELDKFVGGVAEGDAVGAGCCVELDGVSGVGDID